MAETVVFAGPCLHALGADRRQRVLAGLELRPPARRGDVTSALAGGVDTIILLDGYFFHELSVAHKELLYALEAGARVIGAASMGALRAAEMASFGMIGVGTIFRWYSEGVIDRDDEVAVMHLPEEYGYQLFSVALVEVRHALARLGETRCPEDGARSLVTSLKRLAFADRTPRRVAALARHCLGDEGADALLAELGRFSLKAEDASEALRLARVPWRRPRRPPPVGRRSMFFDYWCEDHVRVPATTPALPGETTLLRALGMVQLFHDEAPAFIERIRLRYLAASAASRAGLDANSQSLRVISARLSGYVEEAYGGPVLPSWAVDEEARVQALAESGCRAFGGARAAGDWLASEYGLDNREGHAKLLQLLASQYGRLTSWSLVRAFVFSTLLRPALEMAEAADEVYACFRTWSQGARIGRADLRRLAAEFWDCPTHSVEEIGGRRGLLASHGFSVGLWEVLKRVAPAERLPRPINGYPGLKAKLRAKALEYAMPLLPARLSGDITPMRMPGGRSGFPVPTGSAGPPV